MDILRTTLVDLGSAVRAAQPLLAQATTAQKNEALLCAAQSLKANAHIILEANDRDVVAARAKGLAAAFIDRLTLTPTRIDGMIDSLKSIAALPDPVGSTITTWTRDDGLKFEQVRVPIGVLGVIFESRPNVTIDAAALALKSGNGIILRAGSDALGTSRALHAAFVAGVAKAGLPDAVIGFVDTPDRAAVGHMLNGLDGAIDVIIPRGGQSLVARVQAEARVPVFAHLDGVCHVYVDGSADLDMAKQIVLNAKMRRTGVCGAAETLLVDKACAATHLAPLVKALLEADCTVRGCPITQRIDARVTAATPDDWSTEYLDAIIAVRVVDGVEAAIAHINTYGSHHTDCFVGTDTSKADVFMRHVDSAIVLHNASTQFADGGEFGFGAEIGIATGRLHARGPVGVLQLTTMQYRVYGAGHIRP